MLSPEPDSCGSIEVRIEGIRWAIASVDMVCAAPGAPRSCICTVMDMILCLNTYLISLFVMVIFVIV